MKLNAIKKVLITACLCTLLFISTIVPALAANKSRTTDGEVNLKAIQDRTETVGKADPYKILESKPAKEKGGLNEIQGTANKEKMISSDDAQNTEGPIDKIEGALENVVK